MKNISLNLPEGMISDLDNLVKKKAISNRSEGIRTAITKFILEMKKLHDNDKNE